jgi:predicted RNA-binding protein with PIN domain
MSLHYILDGYNVINQAASLSQQKTLEDARRGLLRILEVQRPQGSMNNGVTVVFDGRSDVLGGGGNAAAAARVIFTTDETADDRIKRMVDQSANKKNIRVVTNDREIQHYVTALGGRVITVEQFLHRAHPKGSGVPVSENSKDFSASGEKGKDISKTAEYRITKEMTKIWLEKDKGA